MIKKAKKIPFNMWGTREVDRRCLNRECYFVSTTTTTTTTTPYPTRWGRLHGSTSAIMFYQVPYFYPNHFVSTMKQIMKGEKKKTLEKEPYRFAVMIIFAMPWPIIPHANPTAPYIIPWN